MNNTGIKCNECGWFVVLNEEGHSECGCTDECPLGEEKCYSYCHLEEELGNLRHNLGQLAKINRELTKRIIQLLDHMRLVDKHHLSYDVGWNVIDWEKELNLVNDE